MILKVEKVGQLSLVKFQSMSILIIRYNRRHETVVSPTNVTIPGGGGDSAYDKGGDARRKFLIKPLKETDLGVAQAFFDP